MRLKQEARRLREELYTPPAMSIVTLQEKSLSDIPNQPAPAQQAAPSVSAPTSFAGIKALTIQMKEKTTEELLEGVDLHDFSEQAALNAPLEALTLVETRLSRASCTCVHRCPRNYLGNILRNCFSFL